MFKLFWNEIVLLNMKSYENIGLDFHINIFIFCVAFLFCAFAIYVELTRGKIQLLIAQLKRHKAYSPDTALTLQRLGLNSGLLLKRAIKNNRILSLVVAGTDKKVFSYEEYMALDKKERRSVDKIDFSKERFYIIPESSSKADDIYSSYGFSLGRVLLFCIFIILIASCIAVLIPEILRAINNSIEPSRTLEDFI